MLDFLANLDTAWIALIGTVFGGVGLKGLEAFLARGSNKEDAASQLRDELRSDSKSLRKELRQQEKSLDGWKEKYFMLLQEYLEEKTK